MHNRREGGREVSMIDRHPLESQELLSKRLDGDGLQGLLSACLSACLIACLLACLL